MREERGFGLVDLMVASAIGSLILVTLGTTVLTGFRAVQIASEASRQSDDATLLAAHLIPDVEAALPDAVAVSADGGTLSLVVADQITGTLLRITYQYVPPAGPQGTGRIERTVLVDGAPGGTLTLARHLDDAFAGPVFACLPQGAGCAAATGVSASLAAQRGGEQVVRVIAAGLRMGSP